MREGRQQTTSAQYEIRIRGHLDERWSRWFEGFQITALPGGETELRGSVVDQAALHGVLSRIGDLGLELVLVHKLVDTAPQTAPNASPDAKSSASKE